MDYWFRDRIQVYVSAYLYLLIINYGLHILFCNCGRCMKFNRLLKVYKSTHFSIWFLCCQLLIRWWSMLDKWHEWIIWAKEWFFLLSHFLRITFFFIFRITIRTHMAWIDHLYAEGSVKVFPFNKHRTRPKSEKKNMRKLLCRTGWQMKQQDT